MLDAALDEVNRVDGLAVARHVAEHGDAESYAAERVLDLVRDLRCRLTDRRQGLAAPQLLLGLRGLRHVNEREELPLLALDFERRRVNVEGALASAVAAGQTEATSVGSTRDARRGGRGQKLQPFGRSELVVDGDAEFRAGEGLEEGRVGRAYAVEAVNGGDGARQPFERVRARVFGVFDVLVEEAARPLLRRCVFERQPVELRQELRDRVALVAQAKLCGREHDALGAGLYSTAYARFGVELAQLQTKVEQVVLHLAECALLALRGVARVIHLARALVAEAEDEADQHREPDEQRQQRLPQRVVRQEGRGEPPARAPSRARRLLLTRPFGPAVNHAPLLFLLVHEKP